MKKFMMSVFIAGCVSFITLLDASSQIDNNQKMSSESAKERISSVQEKDDLMRRDEIDGTDTLAIPFDESEIEDEEQIDLDNKADTFPLPHSK